MALDSAAVLDGLKAVLESVAGVKSVTFGWPKAPSGDVAAWITLGGRGDGADSRWTSGLVRRDMRMIVWLGFSVGTAPSGTERALAVATDDLEVKLYQARSSNLSGLCEALKVDFTLADNPDYLTLGGTERRVYPVGVSATQALNTNV